MLTATSYDAEEATFRQKFRGQGLFWFFQGLMAGYKLPGIVRQRATSLSAVQLGLYRAFAFVVFRILSVTCSLMHALSQSLVHVQQLFSTSTPGQILARGFLFIKHVLHTNPPPPSPPTLPSPPPPPSPPTHRFDFPPTLRRI